MYMHAYHSCKKESSLVAYISSIALFSDQEWMTCVKLKLNPDKTEFIIFGDKHNRDSLILLFLFIPSNLYFTTSESRKSITLKPENPHH